MAVAKILTAPTSTDLSQFNSLQDSLNLSRTAYTPNIAPTLPDLRTQLDMSALQDKIDKYSNQQRTLAVYGPNQLPPTDLNNLQPRKTSLIGNLENLIRMPSAIVTGAVGSVLGKGTSGKGFLPDIAANLNEHQTYGDILRKEGVNSWVAAPLGFALDVAGDPLTWATAGSSALLPKLEKGLVGGGVEGLGLASKAWGLQKVDTLANRIPLLSKLLVKDSWRTAVDTAASAAESAFRTGANLPSVVEEAAAKSQKTHLGETIMNLWNKSGLPGAKGFEQNFEYAAGKPYRAALIKGAEETKAIAAGARSTSGQALQDEVRHEMMFGPDAQNSAYNNIMGAQLGSEFQDLQTGARNAMYSPTSRGVLSTMNSGQIGEQTVQANSEMDRLNAIAQGEVESQVAANRNETGWKRLDEANKAISAVGPDGKFVHPILNAFADAYAQMLGWFRISKISVPGAPYVTAGLGNLGMTAAQGVNVTDPLFGTTMKAVLGLQKGSLIDAKIAQQLLDDKGFLKYVTETPDAAAMVALDKTMIGGAKQTLQEIARTSRETLDNTGNLMAKEGGKTAEQLVREQGQLAEQAIARAPIEDNIAGISPQVFFGRFGDITARMRKAGQMTTVVENGMVKNIEQGVKWLPNNFQKALVGMTDKFTRWYSMIDQTFKAGTTMHLALNGVTASELNKIAGFVKFAPEDITQIGNRFKFTWEKAGEVANDAFMNYAAMPNFVKVVRSLPVVGAPFAAFQYAALAKTGKLFLNNPALINKMSFLKDEIGGINPLTPLEKVQLGSEQKNYLNSDKWTRLPFFDQHPVYLNLSNYLFWEGMNAAQPSERQTTNDVSRFSSEVVDRLPFLKTPEGQILYDYVVQPLILRENNPTGMFGQPLTETTDNVWQKYLERPLQSGVQAIVPNVAPGGYRFTQLMNAIKGKTSQGIDSSQDPNALFNKALLGTLGIPLGDIDIKQLPQSLKDQINPPKKSKK